MMYPFMTLDEDTEITHSEMLSDGRVKVYIEQADEKASGTAASRIPRGFSARGVINMIETPTCWRRRADQINRLYGTVQHTIELYHYSPEKSIPGYFYTLFSSDPGSFCTKEEDDMSEKNNILPEIIPGDRHPDYKGEIAALLRGNLAPGQLRKKLEDYHERDIAEALELLRRDERCRLYALLDAPTLAGVLEYTEDDMPTYLEELGIRKKLEILPLLDPSTAADYLKGLERAQRSALVDLMEDDVRRDLSFLSSFDEDEIGSRMTTDFVSIRADMTVRQAMKELIRQAADTDNISTLYAVDANGVLVGAIDLKELIIARETTALDDILMTSYPYVYADELVEDCVERIRAYSEDSIPVLNADNRLCGALTAQVVAELVAEELGDDYAKLGGLTAGEDLEEPLRRSVAKRLPWLVILLGLGLVVSSVVGLFERVVTHLTVIICFQSLVLDMAGNVGTQSLAVTIRVLMDEDVSPRQKLALVGKEARVGLMNGLLLGLLSFGAIGLYLMAAKGAAAAFAFSVSFCTGTALLVSMLLSSIIGTTVPILFKRLGVDPAVASGPLITTVNDLVAVTAYYGLAWLLLIEVLHF